MIVYDFVSYSEIRKKDGKNDDLYENIMSYLVLLKGSIVSVCVVSEDFETIDLFS